MLRIVTYFGKMMISRPQVLQRFLKLYQAPNYLEIGVQDGHTFHGLQAARKTAVDPHFRFPAASREAGSAYVEDTSDAYFATLDRTSPRFDVIYLDGLHTFEQTLRDLLAAVVHLQGNGVIVIDDIVPSSYHASLPSIPEFEAIWSVANKDGSVDWMGDVYRLVFFVETFLPAFNYATIADNHGQLVMWRGTRPAGLFKERTVEQISRMEYKDTILSAADFNKMPFDDIVEQVRADLGLH